LLSIARTKRASGSGASPGLAVGATAIAATVTDPKVFRSGRDFAAWIGIVPREDSTGGKHKLGPISKRGDQYLRRILVVGAHAVLKRARHQPEKYPWVTRLLERKPFRVVAVRDGPFSATEHQTDFVEVAPQTASA
jgi:transposase